MTRTYKSWDIFKVSINSLDLLGILENIGMTLVLGSSSSIHEASLFQKPLLFIFSVKQSIPAPKAKTTIPCCLVTSLSSMEASKGLSEDGSVWGFKTPKEVIQTFSGLEVAGFWSALHRKAEHLYQTSSTLSMLALSELTLTIILDILLTAQWVLFQQSLWSWSNIMLEYRQHFGPTHWGETLLGTYH